jgi:tRNA threonylcarbamoyladenosine biosynthesis protein TsaE
MALGGAIARQARAGDVVALIGELGAGKTQLVRGMAEALGLAPGAIASPTFVMMQEYQTPRQIAGQNSPSPEPGSTADTALWLVHVDAYRLRSPEDLESIGWDSRPDGEVRRHAVVVVEWADRLGQALGDDVLEVVLTHAGPEDRDLVIVPRGRWLERWPALTRELNRAIAPPHVCPLCGTKVPAGSPHEPFCSARCRMADLGRWLSGKHVISRPIEQADLESD